MAAAASSSRGLRDWVVSSMDGQARQHDARRYDTMQCDAMRTIDRQTDIRTSVDVDQGVAAGGGQRGGVWPGGRWALEVGDETDEGAGLVWPG